MSLYCHLDFYINKLMFRKTSAMSSDFVKIFGVHCVVQNESQLLNISESANKTYNEYLKLNLLIKMCVLISRTTELMFRIVFVIKNYTILVCDITLANLYLK